MTSKSLGLGQRGSVAEQLGDVRMPAGGVEVGNTLGGPVGNARGLQVLSHHEPRLLSREAGKEPFIILERFQPDLEHLDQLWMERQDVPSAMLRVLRFDRQCRRICFKVERPFRQARQLSLPKSRHVGQEIDSSPFRAIVALDLGLARASGLDKCGELFRSKRTSLVPDIYFGVAAFQSCEGISRETFRLHAPIAECIHCLKVVVVRAMAEVLRFRKPSKKLLDRFRVDFVGDEESASIDHTPHARHRESNVFLCVVRETLLKEIEQLGNRRLLADEVLGLLRTEQASLDQ